MSIHHLFISIDFMLTIKINGWDLKINQPHVIRKANKQTLLNKVKKKVTNVARSLDDEKKENNPIYQINFLAIPIWHCKRRL